MNSMSTTFLSIARIQFQSIELGKMNIKLVHNHNHTTTYAVDDDHPIRIRSDVALFCVFDYCTLVAASSQKAKLVCRCRRRCLWTMRSRQFKAKHTPQKCCLAFSVYFPSVYTKQCACHVLQTPEQQPSNRATHQRTAQLSCVVWWCSYSLTKCDAI